MDRADGKAAVFEEAPVGEKFQRAGWRMVNWLTLGAVLTSWPVIEDIDMSLEQEICVHGIHLGGKVFDSRRKQLEELLWIWGSFEIGGMLIDDL